MKTYLGIDLGGTKLLIGEVDAEGNILRSKKYDSGQLDQEQGTRLIKESLTDYMETVGWVNEKPVAMGVGLIGRIDSDQGIWLQIDPARTTPVNLAEELEQLVGIPCYLDNDVKSATCAEMCWGIGKQSRNFIYLNVGTGIGGGAVVNGRLIRGSHYNAGEVGHTRVGVSVGTQCGCGRTDCVETIAAGVGIDGCARLLKDKYPTSLQIPTDKRVTADEVYRLCKQGDELCVVLVRNAAEALANLIMNLVRVTDPDTIVLGGGIVADGFMLDEIKKYLGAKTMRFVSNGVVLTQLNPAYTGLLGAAAVAKEKSENK